MPLLSNPILPIGAVVIVATLLIYREIETSHANSVASSNARATADASVWAVQSELYEMTNVPAGGSVPSSNLPTTKLPAPSPDMALPIETSRPVPLAYEQ